jgi:putative transposase
VKAGEKAGFPRFKGRNRYRYRYRYRYHYHSFTYKEYGNGVPLDNGCLVLSKIGRIRVHWSRPLEGTPKTVTVSKEADGWYVSLSCAEVLAHPLPPTGQETGIDLGLESFATLADGSRILTPGYYRSAERYLATCQRRVSKRKKGSARRRKAVCWLAKAQQRVRRQRQDFHHKTALALVRNYDVIDHEDLQIRNMVRNHSLAKSISDAGWSGFLAILSFKAANAGREVVAVDPACTSQACSGCSVVVQKGLSVRWHSCPACGTSLHRDHNAAKHIQGRGQRLRGLAGMPAGTNRDPVAL